MLVAGRYGTLDLYSVAFNLAHVPKNHDHVQSQGWYMVRLLIPNIYYAWYPLFHHGFILRKTPWEVAEGWHWLTEEEKRFHVHRLVEEYNCAAWDLHASVKTRMSWLQGNTLWLVLSSWGYCYWFMFSLNPCHVWRCQFIETMPCLKIAISIYGAAMVESKGGLQWLAGVGALGALKPVHLALAQDHL